MPKDPRTVRHAVPIQRRGIHLPRAQLVRHGRLKFGQLSELGRILDPRPNHSRELFLTRAEPAFCAQTFGRLPRRDSSWRADYFLCLLFHLPPPAQAHLPIVQKALAIHRNLAALPDMMPRRPRF